MGSALLSQWVEGPEAITVVDPAGSDVPDGVTLVADRGDIAGQRFDLVIAAVKPQLIDDILADYTEHLAPGGYVLSIAAGYSAGRLSQLLGDAPVFVANIDSVWTDRGDALADLAAQWDPERMDAALLLARRAGAIGFEGGGDFFLGEEIPGKGGRLTFRGEAAEAPFAYMGVHICRPGYVAEGPDGPFSLSGLWRRSAAAGRLFGCVLDGDWMHVGDPGARDEAEARLTNP